MDSEKIKEIRQALVTMRNECLGADFDPDGAVILSHTIRWISFKEDGKPYERTTD